MSIFDAVILGIVEGLTEFLPVSSTGHLILTAELLNLKQTDTLKCFEVVIQLGSILAVLAVFFRRIITDFSLWIKLAVGFVPTGLIGLLAYKHIKALFTPNTVVYMLIIGGVIFIAIELFRKKSPPQNETAEISAITYRQAFIIGLSQCLAMVPGTSRSGATIIAGLLCGLSRKMAASFSFLLALPTMFAATFYDTYKNFEIFKENSQNISLFLIGGVVAFFVALLAIKLFLNFVSKFDYIPFGIYRILLAFVFLIFIL